MANNLQRWAIRRLPARLALPVRPKLPLRSANVAAAAVIILAGALSTAWAFIVPIFQAPDEPAHFDYAISIYTAGHLIAASDKPPGWIVSPYTRYLMKAVDFDGIMQHSSIRAPSGYGIPAYFAAIDARAPRVPFGTIVPQVSYVAAYPFGFYALEALWMRAVSLFTGSLRRALLLRAPAVRHPNDARPLFQLPYGSRFSGFRHGWASASLRSSAFFPLNTLVSSYVQPDNSHTRLSASLYCAARLRSQGLTMAASLPLGIAVGSSLGHEVSILPKRRVADRLCSSCCLLRGTRARHFRPLPR